MRPVLREASGYAAASAIALIFDVATLAVLVRYFSWEYLLAATASFLLGLLVAYKLSITFVFRWRRFADPRMEFVSFAAIGAAGLAINAGTMYVAVTYFGLYYLSGKCVAALFTFVCNFMLRRQLLFTRRCAV